MSNRTSFYKKIQKKVFGSRSESYRYQEQLKHLSGSYESFSFAVSDYDITQHPAYHQADIIHFHYVSNFLDYPSFFKVNQKPIVWTLHDMNPFLGGFHYEGDLQRNAKPLQDLNEQVRNQKFSVLRKSRMHIVTPSKWMLDASQRSEMFAEFPHSHIPNGIDVSVFRAYDKRFCREVFGLPQDKIVLLFISEKIDNYRKGFDLLREAFSELDQLPVVLCAIGHQESLHVNTISVDSIADERLMSLLYNAADAFVLASREDNFPNVVLESTACGIPVIAFPVGGVSEVISDGFNGILAENNLITGSSLFSAIQRYIKCRHIFDAHKIHLHTAQHYSVERQVANYSNLYRKLLTHAL